MNRTEYQEFVDSPYYKKEYDILLRTIGLESYTEEGRKELTSDINNLVEKAREDIRRWRENKMNCKDCRYFDGVWNRRGVTLFCAHSKLETESIDKDYPDKWWGNPIMDAENPDWCPLLISPKPFQGEVFQWF
jgi:hypothetical protein